MIYHLANNNILNRHFHENHFQFFVFQDSIYNYTPLLINLLFCYKFF